MEVYVLSAGESRVESQREMQKAEARVIGVLGD